ncbi:MAG: DUF3429 domain-containing protein [Rhodospirillales bacterium]|nr:DUF3429 domain-containing protein [Rhodospirillales bacterium]
MAKSLPQSEQTSLYQILTYAGTIPFAIGTVCLAVDIRSVPFLGGTADAIGAYGLIIASFLSGAHWGLHLHQTSGWSLFLALISNVSAIGLWIAFLSLAPAAFFIVVSFVFVILLAIDQRLATDGLIRQQYFRTRVVVTFVVVSLLIGSGLMV